LEGAGGEEGSKNAAVWEEARGTGGQQAGYSSSKKLKDAQNVGIKTDPSMFHGLQHRNGERLPHQINLSDMVT